MMNLEHRREAVASLPRFFLRITRYSLFALMLIAFSIGLGTYGYHYFSRLNWIDSFHMSCMILTGMGPVSEMTTTGAKLFSAFFALYSGIAFLTVTAVFFAPIIHRLLHILHVEKEEG